MSKIRPKVKKLGRLAVCLSVTHFVYWCWSRSTQNYLIRGINTFSASAMYFVSLSYVDRGCLVTTVFIPLRDPIDT